MSAAPAGGKPTMIRIGLVGYGTSAASIGCEEIAAARPANINESGMFMIEFLLSAWFL
jgi:hypothetical protein